MYELISTAEGVRRSIEQLFNEPVVGLDTETTSLDPYAGRMRLLQLSTPYRSYIFDMDRWQHHNWAPALEPLRRLLSTRRPIKVAHNAKFDLKWIKKTLGVEVVGLFDTMLGSQMISAGLPERHSLKHTAARMISADVDKSERLTDWSGPLTTMQLDYAANDAEVLLPLREAQIAAFKKDDLIKTATLEFDAVQPVAELELNGFYLDKGRWRETIRDATKQRDIVADILQEAFSPSVAQGSLFGRSEINLGSSKQVQQALNYLGVPDLGTTTEFVMQQLVAHYPIVGDLIEYRGLDKSLTSYGENIIDEISPFTGRIHANFKQIGAPTGRFSCTGPNIQQVPTPPEYRRCFMPEPGNKLVVADYSQIELRILAQYTRDPVFIDAFKSGMDFHKATAASVFGIKPEDVTTAQRYFAKRLNFGVVYGIGAQKLGLLTGTTEEEAETLLQKYFRTYREMDFWLREQATKTIMRRQTRTASGRLVKFHFDPLDKKQVSHVGRNGRNTPIQGTSADILKRALRLLHDRLRGSGAKMVNIVHDEIVVEVEASKAEGIAIAVEEEMSRAGREYVQVVPIKVDTEIVDDWVKH